MIPVLQVFNDTDGELYGYAFLCPGCDEPHMFKVPAWTFNGNLEKPTFKPSLMRRRPGHICHLWLTDGVLNFLSDCTHDQADSQHKLPPISETWMGE